MATADAQLIQFLNDNGIPLPQTRENLDALIRTFLGRTGTSTDELFLPGDLEMLRNHFAVYAPGDPQAAIDINNYLTNMGQPATFSYGNTSGVDVDPGPGPQPYPGVMAGGIILQVERPGPDAFIQGYEYPPGSGRYIGWSYAGESQLESVLGPDWTRLRRKTITPAESYGITMVGDVSEIANVGVSFSEWAEESRQRQLIRMSTLGVAQELLNSAEVQNVLVEAAIAGWSQSETQGRIRQTSAWRKAYPGIEKFQSGPDPEGSWRTYMNQMEGSFVQLGIQKDQDGTYRSRVGRLLDAGVDASTFAAMVPTFMKAQANVSYGNLLNEWLVREGMAPIGFDQWYDVVAGSAPAEIAAVVQKANLAFASEGRFSPGQIEAAFEVGRSEQEVQEAGAELEDAALRLDYVLLQGRYGLTKDDLAAASLGLWSKGKSPEQIRSLARKAITEETSLTEVGAIPGVSVSPSGTSRPGLAPLTPQG